MNFSLKNMFIIFQLKLLAICKNLSIIVAPLLAIAFVILIRTTVPIDSTDSDFSKVAFILGFGLNFNIIMGGIMMSSLPLAEEKEKQTLRVLMTSSINKADFFMGSLLAPFFLSTIVNLILVPLAGGNFGELPLVSFFLMTSLVSLISIILGFVIGIYAKNQVQSSIISFPLLLILTMLPSLTAFSTSMIPIARLFYSGVLINYLNELFITGHYVFKLTDCFVLLFWSLLALGLFRYSSKNSELSR